MHSRINIINKYHMINIKNFKESQRSYIQNKAKQKVLKNGKRLKGFSGNNYISTLNEN